MYRISKGELEMKKLISLGIAACIIVLSLALLAGCATSEKPPASSTPTSPQTEEPTTPPSSPPTEESEPAQASEETLDDILVRASGIESVKFDMVITSTGTATMTSKVWLKGQNMKTETTMEGQTVINIINHETRTMYMYMPDQNMAFAMTYDQAQESPIDETQAISQYHPQITGTETIDGKVCLVVEYSVQGTSTKMWIWQEYGFPLKVVTETDQGTTTIEYKNIEFTDIPDSEFQLPPGVEIMDFPSQS
jgi:outer membrane lipoprotein-sorting protein